MNMIERVARAIRKAEGEWRAKMSSTSDANQFEVGKSVQTETLEQALARAAIEAMRDNVSDAMAVAAVAAADEAAGTGYYDGDGYYITFHLEEARDAIGAALSAALNEEEEGAK